ncbi:MAG: VIT domain-containing protein, partial [Myxococcota bacterium]
MSRTSLVALSLCTAMLCAAVPQQAQAIGLLIPTEPSVAPLAIKSHRVTIDVTDQTAVTRVEQVFTNHTNRQLEATFYFPVPKGATVSDFSLWINGRKTKGAVLEREKARAIYEGIVRRTEDPGLIEYMDGTLFQARIFPVPPHGDQKLQIAFASVMDQTEGMRRLVYPLKTGRSAARLLQDMTVVVNVSSRAPLKTIYSPTHRVDVRRRSDFEATVSTEELGADLERDFLLYMDTGDEDIGLSVLTYDPDGQGGEDGYYLMVLSPRLEVDENDIPSKTVTFVVDTSGSMAGEKMDQARSALTYCLNRLRPRDRFNVVRFSTDVEALYRAPQQATPDRVKQGLTFARRLEASGGTAIDDALHEALGQSVSSDAPHFVIFMTDGLPTVGTTDIQTIIRNVAGRNRQARLFTFGVG